MSRSELHDWEWAIKLLCDDNADKMLAIAQDIYDTAFMRGKNYMTRKQQSCKEDVLEKIRAEIEETYINITYQENKDRQASWGLRKVLQIIDKYKAESEE